MDKSLFFIQCEDWDVRENRPYFFNETISDLQKIESLGRVNIIKLDLKISKSFVYAIHNFLVSKSTKEYIITKGIKVENEGKIIKGVKRKLIMGEPTTSALVQEIVDFIKKKKGEYTLFFFLHGTDFLDSSISHLRLNGQQKKKIETFKKECIESLPLIKEIHLLVLQHEFSCKIYTQLNEAFQVGSSSQEKLISMLINVSKIFDDSSRNLTIQNLLRFYKIRKDFDSKESEEFLLLDSCRDMLV